MILVALNPILTFAGPDSGTPVFTTATGTATLHTPIVRQPLVVGA